LILICGIELIQKKEEEEEEQEQEINENIILSLYTAQQKKTRNT
jgi:hypothetical protein